MASDFFIFKKAYIRTWIEDKLFHVILLLFIISFWMGELFIGRVIAIQVQKVYMARPFLHKRNTTCSMNYCQKEINK